MENSLRKEQHAHQKEISAETALAEVLTELPKVKKVLKAARLSPLTHIDDTFNRISVEIICHGPREHEVRVIVERLMYWLLDSRIVVTE